MRRQEIKVVYVSTYIPKKCGIATFCKDVTNAINLLNPYALAEIMVVDEPEEELEYPWETKYKIIKNDLNTYLQAAEYINQSGCDIVMIEHEFGIFGGQHGEYIVPFLEATDKPTVLTCHTIPENKSGEDGQLLKRIIENCKMIVVMMEQSKKKLIKKYEIEAKKIAVIPHGTPDLTFESTERMKKKRKISNRLVLGNINLLTETKGVEYTLEAIAEIAKKYPEVMAVIVGQTHPALKRYQGEKYRNFLKRKVRQLGIKKNVRFINRYVSLKELIDWLKTMDFYVTPYLDPQQSSSGALAYAIGAGKVCISTPYKYAREVLAEERGVLVPYRNSKAIAKAVTDLWENEEEREKIRHKAYSYGRHMTWAAVALQHLDLFREVIKKNGKK